MAENEPRKFTFLLVSLVAMALSFPIVQAAGIRWLVFLVEVTTLAVLISGARAVSSHRREFLFAIGLAIPAGILQATGAATTHPNVALLRAIFMGAFVGFLSVAILRDVLKKEAVTWDKIQGAISAYLLIGVFWSMLYAIVLLLDPGAIGGALEPGGPAGAVTRGAATSYFSFVTLTTLGYGDISPVSPFARTLATTEAVVGQLFLTVLVARLVGLHIMHDNPKRS